MNRRTRRQRRRLANQRRLMFAVLFVLLMSVAVAAYALTEKEVVLIDNGQQTTIMTRSATVGDMLTQKGIELAEKDLVEPALDQPVEGGDTVVIKRAFSVSVTADFATTSYWTQPVTVAEFLAENDVEMGEHDWLTPSADTVVSADTKIIINRITYRQTQTVESIKPKTIRQEDASLIIGTSKVVTEGVAGERTMTNLVTYKDGVPIAKQELSRVVTVPAVDEVLAVGTRRVISRGGQTYAYSDVLSMRATAYTHTGNRTATGVWPTVGATVAVDPDVIPLGTMLYVEGYGYARAEDTGGAIDGHRIDIFLGSEAECLSWGVRTVRVYVLE